MDQPLTLYRKPKDQPADGVVPVSMSVVQELAPETELSVDAGIVTRNGRYSVVLGSIRDSAFVDAVLERFRRAGYPAEAVVADVDGTSYTRIVLRGLADLRAARNLRRSVAAEFGIDDAWIVIGR